MNDDENKAPPAPFLSRWSRLKREAREQPPAASPAADATPAPALPPLDSLTMESDFSVFLHPKVDEDLRRCALKKLFSDPHFNVMDGLDVYIDDYSQPNTLPATALAGLRQAQNILAWARESKEETAARYAPPPVASASAPLPDESALPAAAGEQPPVAADSASGTPPAGEPTAGEQKP